MFVPLKQRYSTEASLQHGDLRDPPPGRLPQPVGGDGQQQLRAHQRRRQGFRQAEEKHPDVRRAGTQENFPPNLGVELFRLKLKFMKLFSVALCLPGLEPSPTEEMSE